MHLVISPQSSGHIKLSYDSGEEMQAAYTYSWPCHRSIGASKISPPLREVAETSKRELRRRLLIEINTQPRSVSWKKVTVLDLREPRKDLFKLVARGEHRSSLLDA